MLGMTSLMWREEGYPFHTIIPDGMDYYISDSWTSQGYEIRCTAIKNGRYSEELLPG
jgi:hypothetical protein